MMNARAGVQPRGVFGKRPPQIAPSDAPLPAEPEVGKLLVVVAELEHRSRNLLTLVSAIAERTSRECIERETFLLVFRRRLEALARAQAYLTRACGGDCVFLDELITAELAAIGACQVCEADEELSMRGPTDVQLSDTSLEILALALHELTTNSAKYGALSRPGGRLSIIWSWVGSPLEGLLRVEWVETGVVPEACNVSRCGFGRELIERALPYQLGAQTEYLIDADGVRCTIDVPGCRVAGNRRGDA